MKLNFYFLILLALLILTNTSCKRKKLLLNIEFGTAENLIYKEAMKLTEKHELTLEIKNDDSIYYHNLEIDDAIFKSRIYFNDDRLKTGPLRCYDYSLTTLPFTETGNDTISRKGYKVTFWKVFKSSDFDKLKFYLDKKYGNGVFVTENGTFGNDTIYKYTTEDADLRLVHGEKETSNFWGVPVKIPFYTIAYLQVRSKSYVEDFKKENEKRRKELKPKDVLVIIFDPPYIENNYNEFGKSTPKIILNAKDEIYSTYVIDDDVIECKGILSITDAYADTLKQGEIIYKFKTPLTSPIKQQWRAMRYNSYELNWTDPKFDKISNMIKSEVTLKVNFQPTAVVLNDGSVIK